MILKPGERADCRQWAIYAAKLESECERLRERVADLKLRVGVVRVQQRRRRVSVESTRDELAEQVEALVWYTGRPVIDALINYRASLLDPD